MKKERTVDQQAAFDWGKGVGRGRKMNHEFMGTARGTYLRGALRLHFNEGLQYGYESFKHNDINNI